MTRDPAGDPMRLEDEVVRRHHALEDETRKLRLVTGIAPAVSIFIVPVGLLAGAAAAAGAAALFTVVLGALVVVRSKRRAAAERALLDAEDALARRT
jgi:hypothetical protein